MAPSPARAVRGHSPPLLQTEVAPEGLWGRTWVSHWAHSLPDSVRPGQHGVGLRPALPAGRPLGG